MPSTSRTIAAGPEVVWDLLTDLAAWPQWGPTVAGATLRAERFEVGARGTVRTTPGLSLPFEITEVVDGRRWAWSVAGVRATTHEVRPAPGGCTVTFTVPWWAPGYLAVCALALVRVERLAVT